jgi:hypothetical protein
VGLKLEAPTRKARSIIDHFYWMRAHATVAAPIAATEHQG